MGLSSWSEGSPERRFAVSCVGDPSTRSTADPRPLEGWGHPSAPLKMTLPRTLSQRGLGSLAFRNGDRGTGDPRLGKLVNFSRPRLPSPPSVRGRLFSPTKSPSAANPEAADRSAQVQGLGAHRPFPSETSAPPGPSRGRGLQAAAVAPPNRLPTATSGGRWAGRGGGPVRLRAHAWGCGAWLARGPAQTRRLCPPYLPTSSAWRRRCVRRGLPRVLRAGAAHWSLVLEAAAAAAAAPVAPPPPLVAVAVAPRA